MERSGDTGADAQAAASFLGTWLRSFRHPDRRPRGVNRWDEPLEGRVPVVLIHGTWMNSYNTWKMLAPRLTAAGHAVFCFDYGRDTSSLAGRLPGVHGTRGLLDSRAEVAAFIDEVLERTGARQVDLVAHSQGVAQARMYLTDSGGADAGDLARNRVRRVIGLGGSNHGTYSWLPRILGLGATRTRRGELGARILRFIGGQAALDQLVGSPAMAHLNRNGDTVPGVDYTMLCTRYDTVVTPWRTQFLEAGPGARVRNVLVQQGAFADFSDHLAMLYSPHVIDLVLEALADDAEDYRAAHPAVTGTVLPLFGALPRHLPRVSLPRRRRGRQTRRSRRVRGRRDQ